jgi:uncharacterized protein
MKKFVSIDHLSLAVRDIPKEREFYRSFLGLREGTARPGYVEMWAGDALLALSRADYDALPEGLHFGFKEESREAVDAWGRRAREHGLKVTFGPGQTDWGGYALYFRDPEGYEIEIWHE